MPAICFTVFQNKLVNCNKTRKLVWQGKKDDLTISSVLGCTTSKLRLVVFPLALFHFPFFFVSLGLLFDC